MEADPKRRCTSRCVGLAVHVLCLTMVVHVAILCADELQIGWLWINNVCYCVDISLMGSRNCSERKRERVELTAKALHWSSCQKNRHRHSHLGTGWHPPGVDGGQ